MKKSDIAQLLADLDEYECPIPLDDLTARLRSLKITLADVKKHVKFGADCYQRNSLHIGPAYQALILCWRSGQRSPIHDHTGSACGVRVLEGTGTEVVFDRSPCGLIYPTHTNEIPAGSVCGSFDSDMHQMGNLQPAGQDLVTLHIYSPPLTAMKTYFLGNAVLGEDDAALQRIIQSQTTKAHKVAGANGNGNGHPAAKPSRHPARAPSAKRSAAIRTT